MSILRKIGILAAAFFSVVGAAHAGVVPVPEPGTMALLAAGAGVALALRRFRGRK